MIEGEVYSLLLAIATAGVSGLIGSFALLKRMTLAGDAISHIALPGLGLALLLNFNPLLGGAVALLFGTLLIFNLESRAALASETAIGVIFTASLALGALITPEEELIHALFGGFDPLDLPSFLLGLLGVCLILFFIVKFKRQLILSVFSEELAKAHGLNVRRLNFLYLLAFSLSILLGLRFLGAVLVGALIIVPAAISRQLTHTLKNFLLVSSLAAMLSVLLGFFLARSFNLELGPTIVTAASLLFLVSLFKKKD